MTPGERHAGRGEVVAVLGSSGEGRQGQVSEALRGVWIFSSVESRTSAELQEKWVAEEEWIPGS